MKKITLYTIWLSFFLILLPTASFTSEENSFTAKPYTLSSDDKEWMEKLLREAHAIQTFTHQQCLNPGSAPEQDFLNLPPAIRNGAQEAVNFMREFIDPASSSTKDDDVLDTILDDVLQEMEKKESSDSDSEEEVPPPFKAPSSPPRDYDTSFERACVEVSSTIEQWYESQARINSGNGTFDDLAPALGAIGIDGIILASKTLDEVTFGAFSTITELIDDGAQFIRTCVRRSVRTIADSQLIGQEAGDYTYVVLSTLGGKGLKNIKLVQTLNGKISRVRKINDRMPRNFKYANSVFPLEKLPLELRQKYPHSVPFTGSGFPDFSRYSIKNVRIELTGSHDKDFALANKLCGYKSTPQNYTWHHHQDTGYMQLVPTDIHGAVKHTGGVASNKGKLS